MHLGCLVEKLVHGYADEVHEHELGNGPQTGRSSARRSAHDGAFGNGSVTNAAFAEFVEKPLGHAETTAELAHIFTDDEHIFVPLHLLAHGIVDRLQVGFDGHIFLHYENMKVVP